MGITIIPMSSMRAVYRSATDSVNAAKEICKQYVTVHPHVNHSADWHGGYTFWLLNGEIRYCLPVTCEQ